jgi:phosphotransferase system HPr (HPr) family protein
LNKSIKEITVTIQEGIHARPAALIVQKAIEYSSDIKIHKNDLCVNAKNILELLTLCATFKTILTIEANGHDAKKAIEELSKLF